jgi:hypothetical protein
MRTEIGSKVGGQAISKCSKDCAESVLGHLPIRSHFIHDLIEPDVGRLDRFVEYV